MKDIFKEKQRAAVWKTTTYCQRYVFFPPVAPLQSDTVQNLTGIIQHLFLPGYSLFLRDIFSHNGILIICVNAPCCSGDPASDEKELIQQ